jgi:murein DD-endopeptidase MepM/ murein hydrolase activator NlpD
MRASLRRFGAALLVSSLFTAAVAAAPHRSEVPGRVSQGALVRATALPGSTVTLGGRTLRVDAAGGFVFGVGRDERGPVRLRIVHPDGAVETIDVAVVARAWPIEHVRGVPPKTVDPPPEIAARIAREQAAVAAARVRDDAREDYADGFAWPVTGRISGRFGSARSYNGKPGTPHSGTDVAAASGTALHAPAAGIVSFAEPDLYLTGGTVLLDHGHGVSSAFLHLSRIDVQVGERVAQGAVLGAVGATGRATGPHMHWGLNWFEVRLDPELVAPPMPAATTRQLRRKQGRCK